ncbi:MAG: hypothetical protein HFE74_02365 [Firmicutes bacterium]|jgi:hypothetical protein|nr:hypothetical protein [Bacillota bacterium]
MYIYTYSPYSTLIALILFALICFCAYFHMTIFVIIRAHLKFLPFYNKLEKECNAKYPTVMDGITGLRSFNVDTRDELETFFLVSDSSFHIVSSTRPDLQIEIPYKSVICQACDMNVYSKYDYEYYIDITFKTGRKKENLSFHTLEYNHRIDKIYGTRLSGEELYNFITKHFKKEKL